MRFPGGCATPIAGLSPVVVFGLWLLWYELGERDGRTLRAMRDVVVVAEGACGGGIVVSHLHTHLNLRICQAPRIV